MIRVKSANDIVDAYLRTAYRRVYSESIDQFGNYGDFDVLYNNRTIDKYGHFGIPYEDYYCNEYRQREIIESILDEPYCIRHYKTEHRLKKYQKHSIRFNFSLGCSPCGSARGFIRRHPDAIQYINDEEKEDL